MPGLLGRRALVAAVLAVISATASACVFDLDPPVTCESVAAEECDRAVDMARPLLGAHWADASEVWVHPGSCSQSRGCSPRRATDLGFITVELESDQPEAVFVVIDRHNAEWTAMCSVTVPDANGAHGEACAEQ